MIQKSSLFPTQAVTSPQTHVERFEAVDVEDSDELVDLAARSQGLVDLDDDPVEQIGVDALGEGVSGKNGLKSCIERLVKVSFYFLKVSFHSPEVE